MTISKRSFEELGLKEGEYIEVSRRQNHIMIKPKKLVDADDILSKEKEEFVLQSERELQQGKSLSLGDLMMSCLVRVSESAHEQLKKLPASQRITIQEHL